MVPATTSSFGGDGTDVAFGGDGDDDFFGSSGPDRFTGGAGRDGFFAGDGDEVIVTDFQAGVDRFDIFISGPDPLAPAGFQQFDSNGDRFLDTADANVALVDITFGGVTRRALELDFDALTGEGGRFLFVGETRLSDEDVDGQARTILGSGAAETFTGTDAGDSSRRMAVRTGSTRAAGMTASRRARAPTGLRAATGTTRWRAREAPTC